MMLGTQWYTLKLRLGERMRIEFKIVCAGGRPTPTPGHDRGYILD
jgi:hypothetical protein